MTSNSNLQMKKISFTLPSLPKKPGVYIYKDQDGAVLYVGKAKDLKNRVSQYFRGTDERPQIPFLMQEAKSLDFTVVSTELESLYLEQTLIQKYRPKYNILQKDDKSYAFIVIDYSTQIPQITISRNIELSLHPKPLALSPTSFGPYSAAYKAKEILKTVRYIFSYCANEKIGQKPCFYFHLHRCPGVCIGSITLEEYAKHLDKIKKFLQGDIIGVKKEIAREMQKAAAKKLFEKAARLRNQIKSLESLEQKQNVIMPKKVSWDVVGQSQANGEISFSLLKVRQGKLADKENFVYKNSNIQMKDKFTNVYKSTLHHNPPQSPLILRGEETGLQRFLEDYYSKTSDFPKKIYTGTKIENQNLLEALLKERSGKTIKINLAIQKQPQKLWKIAEENALEFLKQKQSSEAFMLDRINAGLEQLKEVLNLKNIPRRIECYDISNTQGTNAVGSMVVFEGGMPKKSEYRKFKIRTKDTPDDFQMMQEMLSRRLAKSGHLVSGSVNQTNSPSPLFAKEGVAKPGEFWPIPDLIVIDGGKGQLSAALEKIESIPLALSPIPLIGLAKRIEEIFLPGNPTPIVLSHDQPGLQMLQRLRDEAHRFGITFHRSLRSKQAVKSALDEIPGVGPKTKKLLKTKFGTVSQIKNSSLEELAEVVGQKLAETIKKSL